MLVILEALHGKKEQIPHDGMVGLKLPDFMTNCDTTSFYTSDGKVILSDNALDRASNGDGRSQNIGDENHLSREGQTDQGTLKKQVTISNERGQASKKRANESKG